MINLNDAERPGNHFPGRFSCEEFKDGLLKKTIFICLLPKLELKQE